MDKDYEEAIKELYGRLDHLKSVILSSNISDDPADVHYLNGKLEGFEEALMYMLDVDDADAVYDQMGEWLDD